jgi:hypothetical protein
MRITLHKSNGSGRIIHTEEVESSSIATAVATAVDMLTDAEREIYTIYGEATIN